MGDLTVERDEGGLLRSTLEHVVGSLELAGAAVFAPGEDGELAEASEHNLAADPALTRDLALAVLQHDGPLVQELPGAGWLAATPLRARQRSLGVLVLHEGPSAEPSLDRELLEVLGQQVGTGIENVRLFAELRAASARAEVAPPHHRRRHLRKRPRRHRPRLRRGAAGPAGRSTAWPAASSTTRATTSRW